MPSDWYYATDTGQLFADNGAINLAIPNVFLGNSPDPISKLDDDFTAVATVVNERRLLFGLLAARPAAQGAWVQVAAPLSGLITAAGTLQGSGTGAYTTTSATFVDVDATNLKVTVAVPTGSKFLIVEAMLAVLGGLVDDGLPRVQILAAGTPVALGVYCNNSSLNPVGIYTLYAVVPTPTAGSQTIALQFRADGTHVFSISNPSLEGDAGGGIQQRIARMKYTVTN